MARVVTYIQPKSKGNGSGGNIDTSNLATKVELQEGIREAKDYTDEAIQTINNSGGSSHVHSNMAALNKLNERNGDLYYGDVNLNASNVIFETVEG